jgi:hypothetical protein
MLTIKNIFFFTFFSFILCTSCKNDLKLNAPYKEYPSVYAILIPQEKIQMIRINKVFLGDGDANKMAQVSDSINYPAGELLVTLTRSVGGVPDAAAINGSKNVITFHDSVIQTAPGSFNTNQRVYVTSDRLFTSGDYVLTITNTKTKNVFTAKSAALDSVKPTGFNPFTPPYTPLSQSDSFASGSYIKYDMPQVTYSIKYNVNTALTYQMTMRLHYKDHLNTGLITDGFVDFVFPKQAKSEAVLFSSQGPFLSCSFKGSEIYESVAASLLKSSVPKANITGRRMYKAQYIIYSSTQDYVDYLAFSAPSLSIAQEKPLYSNFDNRAAIGIFTFRARHSVYKTMATEFVSQFANNTNTCKYKFYTSDYVIPFCP